MTPPTTTPATLPEVVTPVRERTPSDVLLAAARYIEEHGWWPDGDDEPESFGVVCASNAIAKVSRGATQSMLAAHDRLMAYLHFDGDNLLSIWKWNDAPGRTRDEVLAALRAAAR